MKRSSKPTILLPVEIQAREWDAKLLFAGLAAERGFQVILGHKARLKEHLASCPRSYYLAKGVGRTSWRLFRILNLRGHTVLAWDEEAVVYMRPEFYLRRKVWEASLAEARALFAWGDDNAQLWRRLPAARQTPIHVTGNPRGDLLRPELRGYFSSRVRRLRERYGDLILFNSNFGQVNHFVPEMTASPQPVEELPESLLGSPQDPRMALHRHRLFERFQAVIPQVAAAFPDHRLVIRPHPSEGHAIWRHLARGFSNVEVRGEGGVLEWILASKVVLHNGCTSAVEAFLLGRPAVAYQPVTHELYDIPLPNDLSHAARSEEELVETLAERLSHGSAPPDAARIVQVRRHIAATEGPLAGDRVLDEIMKLEEGSALSDRRPSLGDRAHAQVQGWIRSAGKRLAPYRGPFLHTPRYQRHCFPDLDVTDAEERLGRFQKVLGRFSGLRVRPVASNLFAVDVR